MLEIAHIKRGMDYPDEIIQLMRKFYHSLSEKDRRRYAAIEASKLGHGGISYIARILGCSRDTVKSGMQQLEKLSVSELSSGEVRKRGAGRKRALETMEGLEAAFCRILDGYDLEDSGRVGLSQRRISALLEAEGFKVSVTVIRQLIKKYETG